MKDQEINRIRLVFCNLFFHDILLSNKRQQSGMRNMKKSEWFKLYELFRMPGRVKRGFVSFMNLVNFVSFVGLVSLVNFFLIYCLSDYLILILIGVTNSVGYKK